MLKTSWGREDLIMILWASIPQWYSCKPSVLWSSTYKGFTDKSFSQKVFWFINLSFLHFVSSLSSEETIIRLVVRKVVKLVTKNEKSSASSILATDFVTNAVTNIITVAFLPETLSGSIDNESTFGPSLIRIRPKLTGFASETVHRL